MIYSKSSSHTIALYKEQAKNVVYKDWDKICVLSEDMEYSTNCIGCIYGAFLVIFGVWQ